MIRKVVVVFGLIAALSSFGWAQKSNIAISVNGLACSTPAGPGTFSAIAWNYGATNTTEAGSGSGGGAGKANVSDLNVSKAFDSCSPALFGGVVTGKHYQSVTLTQTGKKDSDYLVVTLMDVLISQYQLSGDQSKEGPSELISFNFAKICIFESSSGSKFCFDKQTGSSN